jgi:hypothetical protein
MSATGIYRAIRIDWTNPNTDTFCNTEVWVASVNDRSTAALLAAPVGQQALEQSYTHTGLTPGDIRYYWRRPRDFDGTLGSYEPSGATSGWQGTAINLPTADIKLTWTEVTGTSQTMVSQNGYIANNASLVTLTLPTTALLGDVIIVIGKGAGGWTIAQNASQSIVSGDVSTTVGTGGSYAGVLRYNSVVLRCTTANTTWTLEALTTDVTTVWHGLVPKAPNDTTKFLRGDATWATPGGSTQGLHTIYVPASAMTPSVTNGAGGSQVEMATNKNNVKALSFVDGAALKYACFQFAFPKAWNLGTVTYRVRWTLNSTSTNSVVFGLQAVATSDGDVMDVAYGTAITITDAGLGTTAYKQHTSATSSALTIAGTPAAGDMIDWRVYRDPTNGSDTLAATAEMIGIEIYYTTNADTDA